MQYLLSDISFVPWFGSPCSHTREHTHPCVSTLSMYVNTSGEDSRVHESSHAEVGEGEEEDYSVVDGNDRGEVLRQPRAPGWQE